MESSPRSSQVALRILILFLLILFLTSVACRLFPWGPDLKRDKDREYFNAQETRAWAQTLTRVALTRAAFTPKPTLTPVISEMESIRPTETPNPTQVAYVSGFAGSWDTNWGVMTCSVDGQRVNCNYTHDNGKIEATLGLDGMTMEGTWSEAPSYQPPEDGGRVTFSLSEDGNIITGRWWYGQNGEGGPWTGTRK
jgi:hypothetical protein